MYLYQDANTYFHKLHPVTKVLLLILMIVIAFLASTLPLIAAVFTAYFVLLILANGLRNIRRFWKMLLIFWVFTFLIWMIVPKLRGWPVSPAGAALLATRIDSFVLCGILFVTCCRIEEFTFALTRMGIPYKGAFTISLGFRLVPLFYQNLETIVAAQRSRGVDLDSGPMLQRAGRFGPILAVLISFSLRNADLMAMSLEAKGFGYSKHRTSFLQPAFGWRDASLFSGAAGILVLFLQ